MRSFLLAFALFASSCASPDTPEEIDLSSIPRIVFESHLTELDHIAIIVPPGSVSANELKSHSILRTDGVNSFDLGLQDLAVEVDTPNPPYRSRQLWRNLHGVRGYDYFADGLRPGCSVLATSTFD